MKKVQVYTDGSCLGNPGPGGYGVIFCYSDKTTSFGGGEQLTTNNRMELTAIRAALLKMEKNVGKGARYEYEIFSDSAYAVNALNSGWLEKWRKNGWKTVKGEDIKNRDIWLYINESLDLLSKKKIKIAFKKVKGHSGNSFNECVDEIARKYAKKQMEGK